MIGERLQELRKRPRCVAGTACRALGVSHYTISSYECNRSDPDDNSKIIIAKLFDVSVDYLIGLIDEPLSFNRNIRSVSLPQSFTKEECGDVLDYIKYLEFKKSKINE